METEVKPLKKKKFDAVEFAREQKVQISKELDGKTDQEIIEYFANCKNESSVRPSV